MAKIDINKAMNESMNRMSELLFRPFIFKMWIGLSFASIMAGLGGGGSGGGNSFQDIMDDKQRQNFGNTMNHFINIIQQYLYIIIFVFIIIIAISLLFTWLSSIFKFVYTNMIIRKSYEIKKPFAEYMPQGMSYFKWSIVFGSAILIALGVLVGLPAFLAFKVFEISSTSGISMIVLGGLLFISIIIITAIIDIFARDFALTVMYIKGCNITDAWKIVIPLIRRNIGQCALYLLILIVIAIAAGVLSLIAVLASVIVIALPAGIIALAGYFIISAQNLGWNSLFTILYISIFGSILIAALIFLIQTALQPVMVFRRAFSLNILGQLEPLYNTMSAPEPAVDVANNEDSGQIPSIQ